MADFGGDTAGFSILRFDSSTARRFQPVAHSGIGLADDQFNDRIVNHAVAPVIDNGNAYNFIGKTLPVPWSFSDFMWHRLVLLNTPANLQYWDRTRRHSNVPETIEKLIHIIENNLSFQLSCAVATARNAPSQKAGGGLTSIYLDTNIIVNSRKFET